MPWYQMMLTQETKVLDVVNFGDNTLEYERSTIYMQVTEWGVELD